MEFILDIHCHTINSGHAYSTITENAEHAASIGLTHIGIADHAPAMPGGAHIYHFTNIWSLPDEIKGVRVFKGAEANILDHEGKIDLPVNITSRLDFVIASMHRDVIRPASIELNTQALINAMQSPNIHIIGHPIGAWYEIDIEDLVKEAAQTHTILELNDKTINPSSNRYKGMGETLKMLGLCKEKRVPLLVASDAHFSADVGNFRRTKALLESFGIDESLILNTSVERFLNAIEAKKG